MFKKTRQAIRDVVYFLFWLSALLVIAGLFIWSLFTGGLNFNSGSLGAVALVLLFAMMATERQRGTH